MEARRYADAVYVKLTHGRPSHLLRITTNTQKMSSATTNIYILRLAGGRYYVGKTENPMQRYAEHLAGRGSAWTRKYRPVGIEKVIEGASPFDEDKITKEYMAKHGINNVRGGAYVSVELDEVQQESVTREIWASSDCCTTCGRKGHFAAGCYAQKDVNGDVIEYEEETRHIPKSSAKYSHQKTAGACHRCGRAGHYASGCYAKKDSRGRELEDNDNDEDEDDDDDGDESGDDDGDYGDDEY